MVQDQNNSTFVTYEVSPGIYTFKDISEFILNILQAKYPGSSNVIVFDLDGISMKTKLVVGDGITAIRFDENIVL